MFRIIISVLILVWAGQSRADNLLADLIECRGIQSLAQRLQCYDRLVDRQSEVSVSPKTIVTEPTPPKVSQPSPPEVVTTIPPSTQVVTSKTPQVDSGKSEDLFGKSESEVKATISKELEIKSVSEIASKVTRIQISARKEYVVYLENGQIWRQKDNAGSWRIKVGETAIISKAALGSYLMKSDARKKSVRAERVR